jgi:hypothetical protein
MVYRHDHQCYFARGDVSDALTAVPDYIDEVAHGNWTPT